jgi:hypothetical protein
VIGSRNATALRRRVAGCLALLLFVSLAAGGCATGAKPDELFVLSPDSPANKAMQTRQFETPNSDELLSASAAVLQDLGFQITESARDVGFLRAAKERSAREYSQEINRVVIALLTLTASVFAGANTTIIMPVDLHQQINASMIAQPVQSDDKRQEVRILFYRLVWKGDGRTGDQHIPPGLQKMEMIRDPEIYQQFFFRLSKAVFLEAQKI